MGDVVLRVWVRTRAGSSFRHDTEGRAYAGVHPPGDADGGHWGWFAIGAAGHSRGGKTDGGEYAARALADAAWVELAEALAAAVARGEGVGDG